MNKDKYMYDAFISYRHLPKDKEVAIKLQKLLETFRAPREVMPEGSRRIGKVFRDQSELPLSSDLGSDIHLALENAKYLILICSPETTDSRWCMEEVRYFKELHGGSTRNILTVVVDGEPRDIFPDDLRYELREKTAENGDIELVRHEIESLCADVRADSIPHSLKKLKTEFLRIAAGILGCSYDELYRRHRRRKLMNGLAVSAASVALAAAVWVIVGSFADTADDAKAGRYYQQGLDSIENAGDTHLGMMYFVKSLELNPKNKTPQTSALALLIQNQSWGFSTGSRNGKIVDGVVVVAASDKQELDYQDLFIVDNSIDLDSVFSVEKNSSLVLIYSYGSYIVKDSSGLMVDEIREGIYVKPAADYSAWIFHSSGTDLEYQIYNIARRTLINISIPEEIHPNSMESSVCPVADIEVINGGDEVIISYGGYVYFYRLENETYAQYKTLDLEMFFDNTLDQKLWIYPSNRIYADPSGRILAVENLRTVCLINLRTFEKMFEAKQYQYLLSNVSFSGDSRYIAVAYGAGKVNTGDRTGGFFAIYDIFGKQILSSEDRYDEAVAGVRFNDDGDAVLTRCFDKTLRLWEIADGEGKEMINPVLLPEKAEAVAFGNSDYAFAASDSAGVVSFYSLVMSSDNLVMSSYDDGYPILFTARINENEMAVLTNNSLVFFDASSGDILAKYSDVTAEYGTFFHEYGTYMQKQGLLGIIPRSPYIGDGKSVTYYGSVVNVEDENENVLSSLTIDNRPNNSITGAAFSLDRKRVYIVRSGNPSIAEYEIDFEDYALKPVGSAKALNYSPDGVWVGNKDNIVVSAAGGMLLVYDASNMNKARAEIRLLAEGEIKELRVSDNGVYLAVSIQKRNTASTLTDIVPYGVLEVWDIASGLLITRVTDNKSYLNGLCFDGEYLYYALDEKLYRKWLPSQNISQERLAFFSDLSGYGLNSNSAPYIRSQQISEETRTKVEGDAYSGLYAIMDTLPRDGEKSISDTLDGLRTKRLLDGDALALESYAYADAGISNGSICGNMQDLGFFYNEYILMLRQTGINTDVRSVMERFVTNMENEYRSRNIDDFSSYERAQLSMILEIYCKMAILTDTCDDIIADAMERLALRYDEYDSEGRKPHDTYVQTYQSMAALSRYYAMLLRKDTDKAVDFALEYLDNEDNFFSMGMMTELALLLEEPIFAAECADSLYEPLWESYDEKKAMFDYTVSYDLDWLYALMQRELLTEECIMSYLEARSLQTDFRISYLTEKARTEGFLEGDILISIDNERIFSSIQVTWAILNSSREAVTAQVLRNGEVIAIESVKNENKLGIGTEIVVTK